MCDINNRNQFLKHELTIDNNVAFSKNRLVEVNDTFLII